MKDRQGSSLAHTVSPLKRTDQLYLFQKLGQLQRELGMHALGTNARKRVERDQALLMDWITALMQAKRQNV